MPLSGAWEAGLGVSKEVHPQFGAGLPGAGGLWESRLRGWGWGDAPGWRWPAVLLGPPLMTPCV